MVKIVRTVDEIVSVGSKGFTCDMPQIKKKYSWLRFIFLISTYYYYFKKVRSARLRESDIHPYISPKTPASQYQPINRKKRKEKK